MLQQYNFIACPEMLRRLLPWLMVHLKNKA